MARVSYVKSGEPQQYGQSAAATSQNIQVVEIASTTTAVGEGPHSNLGQSGGATSANIKKVEEAVAQRKGNNDG